MDRPCQRVLGVAAFAQERSGHHLDDVARHQHVLLVLLAKLSPFASKSTHGDNGMVAAGIGRPCSRARSNVVIATPAGAFGAST